MNIILYYCCCIKRKKDSKLKLYKPVELTKQHNTYEYKQCKNSIICEQIEPHYSTIDRKNLSVAEAIILYKLNEEWSRCSINSITNDNLTRDIFIIYEE